MGDHATFAADVAETTVCYASVSNTSVGVIVPEGAPIDDLHDVMDRSREYGYVCTIVRPINGEAFAFELEFTPLQAVAIEGGPRESDEFDGSALEDADGAPAGGL